ncbi:MAG: hypothetical protein LV479_12200 [Methylacidiphilales bacterium]|nr:hypothetical protein [Candidatus Methylacidiphilales bacterium]
MSEPVFLQIIMQADDLNKLNFGGRDEIEEPLEKALDEAGLGEVSGGGSGGGVAIIDVDIENEDRLAEGLKVIRHVLREIVVPPSTVIKQTQPIEAVFKVYDDENGG